MATAVEVKATRAPHGEQRILLPGVDWDGYEALLNMVGDRNVRVTFDGEDAELMSPSIEHDEYAELIGLFLRTVCEELRIPCRGLGTTTWRRQQERGGLEADKCFYLTSFPRVRRKKQIDLTVDPPPGLAVEVEISRSALDRLAIYARLGVPEVWRFDGERLVIHRLQPDGSYAASAGSLELPVITPDDVVRWVRASESIDDDSEWNRQLREWVRAELLPRHQGR